MPHLRFCSTLILAAVLAGCQQAAPAGSTPTASSAPEPAAVGATPLPPANTSSVGARAQELRAQVQQLESSVDRHLAQLAQLRRDREALATQYYQQVGAISAKLQAGTTPSNPILTAKWAEARGTLDKLEDNLSRVTALSNDMAQDGQTGTYLDDSTRAAFNMPGALDEDHSQLRSLQADVAASQVRVGDELTNVTNEINRQSAALGIERNNVATLAESVRVGELLGHSLANGQRPAADPLLPRAAAKPLAPPARHQVAEHHRKSKSKAVMSAAAIGTVAPAAAPAPAVPSVKAPKPSHAAARATFHGKHGLLMVIRFDRFTERYEEALYRAVSQALDAHPNAKFRIEGVTPEASVPAGTAERLADVRRHVGDVQRSMLAFGLTPARISTSAEAAAKAPVEEVRIYRR